MARIGFQIVGWTADQGIDEARLNSVLNQMQRMLTEAGAKNADGEADIPGFHSGDDAVNFRFTFDLPEGQKDARQFAANALRRWYGVGGARLANFTNKSDTVTLRKGTAIINKATGQAGILRSSITVDDPDNFYDASGVLCSVAKGSFDADRAIRVIREVGNEIATMSRSIIATEGNFPGITSGVPALLKDEIGDIFKGITDTLQSVDRAIKSIERYKSQGR